MPTTLEAPPAHANRHSTRRDVVVLLLLAVAVAWLAGRYEINEWVYEYTRPWERYQLDEWPIVALTLALGLVWFSRRRYLLARSELQARERVEAHLTAALADNRRLAQQHLRAQEAAQKHLARELHDELGQYTNAIKLDAVAIQRSSAGTCTSCEPAATRILMAVDHMHGVLSDIVRRLRPAGLDELGLAAALEHCVTHWRQRMPDTAIALSLDGDFDHLEELEALTLYRLVQEALTNASRHAEAGRIDVSLNRSQPDAGNPGQITVTIRDDGRGVDAQSYRPGFGLSGMGERVEMLGGSLTVRTSPHRGFEVTARLPVVNRR